MGEHCAEHLREGEEGHGPRALPEEDDVPVRKEGVSVWSELGARS